MTKRGADQDDAGHGDAAAAPSSSSSSQLPVLAARKPLLEYVRKHQVVVVVGETGSGKTTQLPQILHAAGYTARGRCIAITQPRRVAAVSVARRVAQEQRSTLGDLVGYCVRFDDKSSHATKIRYLTDGMLLREALIDSNLRRYAVIVVDEAHERSLNTDVLLGVLKALARRRRELKIVVMSATLDAEKFSRFFDGAPAVYVRGRQFPVRILYAAAPEPDYLEATMLAVLQVHKDEPPGAVLAFLTGQEEIESLKRLLENAREKLHVVCVYAALPHEEQMRVFEDPPPHLRKVVLATNIAETSLTIAGVRYVIDTGLVKARRFDARSGVQSLQVVPISRAQAAQRCGRAGRDGPGTCFRLYTERSFDGLEESAPPEIARCGLGSTVLQLKALGIKDVLDFDFVDPPPVAAIVKALETLIALGALDTDGELSKPLGRQMAALPLDPMPARALLASKRYGCDANVCAIMALLSVENLFLSPASNRDAASAAHRQFDAGDGDTALLLRIMEAWRATPKRERAVWCRENFLNKRSIDKAADIDAQLRGHIANVGAAKAGGTEEAGAHVSVNGAQRNHRNADTDDTESIRRCLTEGFFLNAAARLPDGRYRCMSSALEVHLHPSSSMFSAKAPCILFNELVETSKKYIRAVTPIESSWLIEAAPRYFATGGTDAVR